MEPQRRAAAPAGEPAGGQLRPVEEAALALHEPGLDADAITARLERLVVDLQLASEPTFLPAALRWSGTIEGTDCGNGIVEIDVRRPDGVLAGVLRCRPRSALTERHAVVLATHAGVALGGVERLAEIERREQGVRRIAERLQDTLLPTLPSLPSTLVAVAYRAASREARVGGDFYDVFVLPNGSVLIVVGDVVGKGVEAAARTARITQTLRALALQDLELYELLEMADRQVTWQDPEIMATLWCGLYDPTSRELAFASLGHPPALLLRADGNPMRLELEGLPLGLRDLTEEAPEVRHRQLESRDLLVLYTDGVVEASRDFLAGQEALQKAIVARRDEPLEQIVEGALSELLADAGHQDDAVMLVLRRR